jgi:hypothetical protein
LSDESSSSKSNKSDSKTPKTESEDVSLSSKQLEALFTKFLGERSPSKSPSPSNRSSRTKTCYWDGCDSPKFDACRDLADWVEKGRVERDL